MIDAAHNGDLDLLYQVGGSFVETLPEPDYVREAVQRIPVRVHQDIILNSQMMIEPNEAVFLLPARTRYEQPGGGSETTTERRILFSPEIPGRRIGESLAEWEIFVKLAEAVSPDSGHMVSFPDAAAIRREIAAAVPAYEGIQDLSTAGDQVQWGGPRLCELVRPDGKRSYAFPTPDGRAGFWTIEIESQATPRMRFRLSTRRGKQFNSMIHRARDPLTGANRDDVFMNAGDAGRLGLASGDAVLVRSDTGEIRARCKIAPIAPGNVQAHWPEANVLIARGACDPECGIPDYNTDVEIVPAP